MAFKLIEDIKVNNRPGRIFDRYIYSCNVNIGFSESPSTIVLNGVAEEAFEISSFPNLALDRNFTIQIGPKTYRQMSLFSAEENYEAGKNITTYTFIDPSFILDKIYVGLMNRDKAAGAAKLFDISFPLACEVCDTAGYYFRYDVVSKVFFLTANEVNVSSKGGNIILGTEEFVLSRCDIPNISYNFSDLIQALSKNQIQNIISIKLPVDKNPDYRQTYTGTLREVLSSWCVDFGYTFYFDITDNTLKFIDLSSPIGNATINEIKSILTQNKGKYIRNSTDVPPYILNYGAKKTLENTYDQNHVSLYKKGAEERSASSDYFKGATFIATTLENIVGTTGVGLDQLGRTIEEIYKVLPITKYFRNLRWAFYYLLDNLIPCGISFVEGPYVGSGSPDFSHVLYDMLNGPYSPLGKEIFKSTKSYWGSSSSRIEYHIVRYDTNFENSAIDWENKISDSFLGKNYYQDLKEFPQDFSFCSPFFFRKASVSTDPVTEIIRDKVYPFVDLIKNEEDIGLLETLPKESRIFTRSTATWDVNEDAITAFQQQNEYDLKRYQPEYYPLDDKIFDMFANAALAYYYKIDQGYATSLRTFFLSLKKQKLFLTCYPAQQYLEAELNFNKALQTTNNTKEGAVYGSNSYAETTNEDCNEICDIGNPADYYCQSCSAKDVVRPSIGLKNRNAKNYSIDINLPTYPIQTFNFIYPSESDFYGYFIVDKNLKWTYPGIIKILGNLNENLNQNTMSINVIRSDITSPIDAYIDTQGNSIVQAPYPLGAGNEFGFKTLSPEIYHDYIHRQVSYSINTPNEIISCKLIGLDFGNLSNYLTPSKGLTRMQITSNENGIFTDLEFSTRPKTLPKQESLLKNTFTKNNTLNSIKSFG